MALRRVEQRIDLLVTDINLAADVEAGMVHPGLELGQQAVKIRPKLRVLYTTGLALTDEMKALFVENSEFLPKPYDVNSLSDTVAGMMPGD
ncbi:MAG TPA: hypothetical protein VK281_15630 [Xanthobacteraceae bacterium]|nr:hypothetical protein [Xanthobacteraceae bacterium]